MFARLRRYRSKIEGFNEHHILYGWAIDRKNPYEKLELDILIDGVPVATAGAWDYREDIQRKFGGDGKYGFSVKLDLGLLAIDQGVVTLREKGTRRILKSNLFYVGFDPAWTDHLLRRYFEEEIGEGALRSEWVELLRKKRFGPLRLRLEEKHAAHEIDEVESLLLIGLYLGIDDTFQALSLYQEVLGRLDPVRGEKLHRMILERILQKLQRFPDEYLSAETIRRLEMLIAILPRLPEGPEPLGFSEDVFESVLAHFLQSGMFPPDRSLERLVEWICGREKGRSLIEDYTALHPLAATLHHATHLGKEEPLESLDVSLFSLASMRTKMTEVIRRLTLQYLEAMIAMDRMTPEAAESTIPLLRLEPIASMTAREQIRILTIELTYLSGDRWKALELFEEQIEKNPYAFDWQSIFFPRLLWLYFLKKDQKIDRKSVTDLLYLRLDGDRASFAELAVLLADLLHWKENVGLGVVQKISSSMLDALYSVEDSQEIRSARRLLSRLTLGSVDDYFEGALEIRKAIRERKSPPFSLHHATLYEDQNLYRLSLIDPATKASHEEAISARYGALSEGCEELPLSEAPVATLILCRSDGSSREKTVRYYRSLLRRWKHPGSRVVIYGEERSLSLCWDGSELVEEELSPSVGQDAFTGVEALILPGDFHLPHHAWLPKQGVSPLYCRVERGESGEWSFILDRPAMERYLPAGGIPRRWSDVQEVRRTIYGAIRRFEDRRFLEWEAGMLSFRNLEKEFVPRLMDLALPLLEVDQPSKAMDYLSELYGDDRITTPLAVNVDGTALLRIKEATRSLDENDLACFLVQRNERMRLEGFFDYYRQRGVSRFYVVDNASDDGETLDWLLDQEDVELYSTPQAYSQSLYGVRWAELLIKSKRLGKWNLLLDADEILMLDEEKYPDFPSLCRALEEEGYDALYTPFLDMYSDRPINETPYRPGLEILEDCAYHDKRFYTSYSVHGGILGTMPTYFGGIRSRAFGLDRVVLNKLPLFRFTPRMKLREGLHWIDHARFKIGEGVLLHFKYIETFHAYVEREIARGQHWNGASEYRKYHEMLRNDPGFSLYDPILSTRFRGVREFFDALFAPYEPEGGAH